MGQFIAMSQKLQFWPKMAFFGLIWHQKRIFSGKMTILSYKTNFGPTFSAILEKLLICFFAMSQKLWFWPKMAIFWHVRPNLGKWEFFSKKGLCYFLPLLSPQLHVKFRKNPWSGFRDQLCDGRTDKGYIIELVALLVQ